MREIVSEKQGDCEVCISHAKDMHGYPHVVRKGKGYNVHRYVWLAAGKEIPEGHVVRHKCDNRACIKLDHLETGTHADNSNDCKIRGRLNTPRGMSRSDTKLTDTQVLEIRSRQDITQYALAALYGVNQSTISRIKSGEKRSHV